MRRTKHDDGLVTQAAVDVWHALREHGPSSATRLHALRKAPGRAASTGERLVELLHADPPCVEVVGLDTTGRGLHARIYKATREPQARAPRGSSLEATVLTLLAEAGGTLDFTSLARGTKAHRDTLGAACKRLAAAGRITKTSGSRPTYSLAVEAKASRPARRDPSAVRISERHGMIDGPCGRRLTVREEFEDA